ncbi:MAG: YetF domain-containing protein, partial [Flavitalea sp.]
VCLIEAGEFSIDNFKKEALAQDEFFAELRVKGISHLGQVKQAIIETSGDISVFFYEDELVKPGLPILPGLFSAQHKSIPSAGIYSCTFCGHTESIAVATPSKVCGKCSKEIWVRSDSGKRVT